MPEQRASEEEAPSRVKPTTDPQSNPPNIPEELTLGLERILANPREKLSIQIYMRLHHLITNYCRLEKGSRGANLRGEDLYHFLDELIKRHCQGVRAEISAQQREREAVLRYYVEQWMRFREAAKTMARLCAYLNRHWVRRETDEAHRGGGGGKETRTTGGSIKKPEIYEIEALHLVRWKQEVVGNEASGVVEAARAEVLKQGRPGRGDEGSDLQIVLDSFVVVGYWQSCDEAALLGGVSGEVA